MNIDKAFTKQLEYRKRKLIEARHPYIVECHEKAIARLVMQRICEHEFQLGYTMFNGRGRGIFKCSICKFSYVA